jgi:cbb3-type cytochrome oxidase maturation protein
MTALVWLIPAALALGALGLAAFLWSLSSGQYEDLEGAGWRALDDEADAVRASDVPSKSDSRRTNTS